MCTFHDQAPTGIDESFVDHPVFTAFIDRVNEIRHRESDPRKVVAEIRPHFTTLLADQSWLPDAYAEPKEGSGMGGGIGMWLLYRAGDGSLAFSALVVPPGAETPVHDHLAWGIVGLYRGLQDEKGYDRLDDGSSDDNLEMKLKLDRRLYPGDMYELLPENDIHSVKTASEETSVSLHLLGNDNGCIWRHRFYPAEHKVVPFKSGWLNVPCKDEQAAD